MDEEHDRMCEQAQGRVASHSRSFSQIWLFRHGEWIYCCTTMSESLSCRTEITWPFLFSLLIHEHRNAARGTIAKIAECAYNSSSDDRRFRCKQAHSRANFCSNPASAGFLRCVASLPAVRRPAIFAGCLIKRHQLIGNF